MPKKFVDFNFLNKYKNLLTVLVAAVILFLAITRGLAAGSQSAEAQTEVQTAKNLQITSGSSSFS